MTEEKKINVINNIKISMEIENQNLTTNDISLMNDFADDKISIDYAIKAIKSQFYSF